MRLLNGSNWLAARDHTINEVPLVIIGTVQMDFARSGLVVEQRSRAGVDRAAIHPNPAIAAFERHAGTNPARNNQLDAALIMGLEIVIGGGVPEFFVRPLGLSILDGDGSGQFGTHPPLGNVGMMTTPICNLPSGVFENPAEVNKAAR